MKIIVNNRNEVVGIESSFKEDRRRLIEDNIISLLNSSELLAEEYVKVRENDPSLDIIGAWEVLQGRSYTHV